MKDAAKDMPFIVGLLLVVFCFFSLAYSLQWLGTHYHEGYQYPSPKE